MNFSNIPSFTKGQIIKCLVEMKIVHVIYVTEVTEVLVSMTDCVICNNMSRDTSGHLKMGKIERLVAL